MKKVKIILSIILFNFLFVGCDSLNQTLQYTSMGLGAVCLRTKCSYGYYENKAGDYKMGYKLISTPEGVDIENSENYWISLRANECLEVGIGIYYHRSPYSNVDYKFVVDCVEWQQNQNQY